MDTKNENTEDQAKLDAEAKKVEARLKKEEEAKAKAEAKKKEEAEAKAKADAKAGARPPSTSPANPKKSKLIALKFTKGYAPYHKGEIAGFNQKDADELIELKVARKK